MEKFEKYVERFIGLSFKDKKTLIDDINCQNGSFEEFRVYEDWNEMLQGMEPVDIIFKTLFGEVKMNDEYLRYASDDNFESINKTRLESEMDDVAAEIVQVLIDEKEDILDKWNKHLYDEIFEEEENEEI